MSGRFVIGIDEAGYGPSMGPLVLGATAWWVPDAIEPEQIWDRLAPYILPIPAFPRLQHIPIGDSKVLLKGVHGWANLSLGAEWMFNSLFENAESAAQLLCQLIPEDVARLAGIAWYESLLKLHLPSAEIQSPYFGHCVPAHQQARSTPAKFGYALRKDLLGQLAPPLDEKLDSAGIRLIAAKARVIDEPEFNRQVTNLGNKSSLLSQLSLGLAKSLANICLASGQASDTVDPPIELFFDKHGGRAKYQSLLMDCFDGEWFCIEAESPNLSKYSGNWQGIALKAQFMAKGDSLLPSASASVIAKWLREISMASLNDFWQSKQSTHLVPTAGYYVDALRFSKEIAGSAERLNLPAELWWRLK